jgi:hypothetical protein
MNALEIILLFLCAVSAGLNYYLFQLVKAYKKAYAALQVKKSFPLPILLGVLFLGAATFKIIKHELCENINE